MKRAIGKRTKEAREFLGLSQTEFGRKIGLSFQHVSRYERGEVNPSAEVLIKIHEKFNVSINWLLTGKGPMLMDERGISAARESLLKTGIKDWIEQFWQVASHDERVWFAIEFKRHFQDLLKDSDKNEKNRTR